MLRRSRTRELIKLGRDSVEGFIDGDVTTCAAALAFRTLLALFPIALPGFLHTPGFFHWGPNSHRWLP